MMRIKYLALLALLTLAFILPTVACGGDEKEHSYSLRDLKLVGFKDAEDITGSFNFPGLQGAWAGNMMFIKPGWGIGGNFFAELQVLLFEDEISLSLKADIQSVSLENDFVAKFVGSNLVLRCNNLGPQYAGEPTGDSADDVCSSLAERVRIEYGEQKPRQ